MPAQVSLSRILEAIDFQPGDSVTYVSRETGEVVFVGEEEQCAAEDEGIAEDSPDWMREYVTKVRQIIHSDDYLELPTAFDINEYHIMQGFCQIQNDPAIAKRLTVAIQGRGAFRYFKDVVHEHGLADDWYQYRKGELKKIAIEWCEVHGLDFKP